MAKKTTKDKDNKKGDIYKNPEESITGDKKGDEFYKELQKYAKKHDLVISNIAGWTIPKIVQMANNNRQCACDSSRTCPCPQGLLEIEKKGRCKCSVFMR